MKKLLMLTSILLLTSCSDNEGDTGFIANEADISGEYVHDEVKSSFDFEEYNEFPDYNVEDTNDFLNKLLVVSLLTDDLDDNDKNIISRIALGDDEYERRFGEVGDNPFKREDITESTYQEAQSYGNSVRDNRKFVFDIDHDDYYYPHYDEVAEEDKKLITAIATDYNNNEPPLKSYSIDGQYFPLFGVNSISINLETREDIDGRKITKYQHVLDEPYYIRMSRLYVSSREKAEKIQDLIDKKELGMAGKVYVEFIYDEISMSNSSAPYKINGIVLDFYDKNTNEILESAQEFRSL